MDESDSDNQIGYHYRRERRFKPRINNDFNDMTDGEFLEKFRVSKRTVQYILSKIGILLKHKTNRNKALNSENQLLCALHWFGCGSQYHVVGDTQGVSKSTIHRCVKRVCNLIIEHLLGEEIRWPGNAAYIAESFKTFANFPNVAGIVDGSLIKIDAPNENESAYVDRHGKHSINAMFVCGPNLEFYYVSARWPGSVHDARVLRNSSLARKWNSGWRPFTGAVILGDSGYGQSEWLITPVIPHQIEHTSGFRRFIRSHKTTRRLVENAIGILKEKFPCLNYLRLSPIVACKVILTCSILHNLEKRMGSSTFEINTENLSDDDEIENNNHEVIENLVPNTSISMLQNLINSFS